MDIAITMLPMPIYDLYFLPWLVTPIIIFLIYLIKHFKRNSVPFLLYVFSYCLYVAFNQQYGVLDYNFTLHLKYFALGALIPLFMVFFIDEWPAGISYCLGLVSIVWPVLGNFSLTSCLMLAFLAVHGFSWVFVVAILVHPTALGVGGLLFYFCWRRFGSWTLLTFLGIPLLDYIDFFSNRGRFHMWKNVWNYFWSHKRTWLGYGPGSATQYGAYITDPVDIDNLQRTYFIFFHNEALQFLFEYGIIGCMTLVPVLWMLRKQRWFPMFCFICVFNWPLRSALFSIFVGWIVLNSLKKEPVIY